MSLSNQVTLVSLPYSVIGWEQPMETWSLMEGSGGFSVKQLGMTVNYAPEVDLKDVLLWSAQEPLHTNKGD